MNILAIDASANLASAAMFVDGHLEARESSAVRRHAQVLLPMVRELEIAFGIPLRELDAIAYGAGPGSFTGLRIALGFAQGLGFGLDIPLLAVCSLKACAFRGLQKMQNNADQPIRVIAALDARMGELYWAAFTVVRNQLQVSTPPTLMPVMDAAQMMACETNEQQILVGPGAELIKSIHNLFDFVDPELEPHAAAVAELALPMFTRGETVAPAEASLTYLRDHVSWNKRTRIRSDPL